MCMRPTHRITWQTHPWSQEFMLARPRLSTENLMLVRGMGRVFLKVQVMRRGS